MKDELVTFETAKLAKEKGFEVWCSYYYTNNGTLTYYGEELIDKNRGSVRLNNECNAPSQSLLQKWLRDNRGISVSVETHWSNNTFVYTCTVWVRHIDIPVRLSHCDIIGLETYEYNYKIALEKGLCSGLRQIRSI